MSVRKVRLTMDSMKKTRIVTWMSISTVVMLLCGCSSEDTITRESSTTQLMPINVNAHGFAPSDSAVTRATEVGVTTTFTKDDAIGIYITDGTNVKFPNLLYTFDGTHWTNSIYGTAVPYIDGGKYFAYYPYSSSYTDNSVTATATTADEFFVDIISGWTVGTDQSTYANYTAKDLMTAVGSCSNYNFTFSMSHQMALVEMDLPQAHYTNSLNGTDGKYKFTFTSHTPYNVADGKYRLLVKPSSSLFITGNDDYNSTNTDNVKTWQISGTSPSAAKIKIYKVNGSSASLTTTDKENVTIGDATIGDYLYNDGTTGTTNKTNTVGIVYSNEGATHGWVISPPDKALYGHDQNYSNSHASVAFQNFPERFPKGLEGSNIGSWQLPTVLQIRTANRNLKLAYPPFSIQAAFWTCDQSGTYGWGLVYHLLQDVTEPFANGDNRFYIIGVLSF